MKISTASVSVGIAALVAAGAATAAIPTAGADVGVYLLNVTVRPVYGFANADHALSYGYGICDKFRAGANFPQVVSDIKNDFNTRDEFSASYLISQAAQELCPAEIARIRGGAAGYRPTG